MKFEYNNKEDIVRSRIVFKEKFVGYENIIHGGIVTTIMDEAMAWMAIKKTDMMCLTSKLNVRFIKAVKSFIEYTVEAKVESAGKDKILLSARVIDEESEIYAESNGEFLIMKGRRSSMMKEKMNILILLKNIYQKLMI